MQAVGQLPLASIEAKIQTRVAKFLASKEPLVRLSKHPSPSISTEAKGLLVTQYSLEVELKNALAKVELIKSGAYTYSDVISVSSFAYDLDKHIKDVQDLVARTGGPVAVTQPEPFSSWIIMSGVALGTLYLLLRR